MSITRYLTVALILPALGLAADAAVAAPPPSASVAAAVGATDAAAKKRAPARRGGRVRKAWPARHAPDRPKTALTRWLARQVGPRAPRCPAPKGSRARCAARPARTRAVAPSGPTATAAAASPAPLQLVRSYEIPTDDPAYVRTLNFSWTYDSALAAAGFISSGDRVQSERLLDQLAALQRTDGSVDSAFNVADGTGSGQFTSGTIAWVGLAEVTHDRTFSDQRYLDIARKAADYLLTLRLDSGAGAGLIRGGPRVTWASTLHNLVAYAFIGGLGDLLTARGNSAGATYTAAAQRIGAAIDANLIVRDADGVHFVQGLGDPAKPIDVQALGAVYLLGRNDADDAQAVRAYAQRFFAISGRAVALSRDPATYNMTYASPGPFAGYRPFAGDGAPDILWSEGTNEMRLALSALGEDTTTLDTQIAQWARVTSDAGFAPLQADRTDSGPYGEFHVWPAAAPAAWTLLSRAAPSFFYAPGASPAVTAWTKVRGGNGIVTYPDGRVDMTAANGGERRVIGGPTGSDYTVTADGTLNYGSGWGVYLRMTSNSSSGNLTAYCVQVDQGFGQVIVRQIQNDAELSTPLARGTPPPGVSLTGRHRLVSRIVGNTLTVWFDGTQVISIPDLAAASASARASAANPSQPYTPPTAGQVGLRSWSAAQVLFDQVTVTPG